jgi:hypothetical protein
MIKFKNKLFGEYKDNDVLTIKHQIFNKHLVIKTTAI